MTNECNHVPDLRAAAGHPLHLHGAGEARGLGDRPALGLGSAICRAWCRAAAATPTSSAPCPDPTHAAGRAVHVRGDRRLRHRHPPAVDGDQAAARGRAGAAARGRHRERPADPDDRRQHLRVAAVPAVDQGFRRRRRRLVLHVLPAVPLRDQPGAGVSVDRQPRHPRDRGVRRPRPGDGQLLPVDAAGERRGGGPRVGRARACSTASASRRTSSSSASIRRRSTSSGAAGCSRIRSTASSSRNAFPALPAERIALAHPVLPSPAVLRRAAAPQHRRHGGADRAVRRRAACAPASAVTSTTSSTRASRASTISCRARAARSDRARRRAWTRRTPSAGRATCHFLLVTIDGDRR